MHWCQKIVTALALLVLAGCGTHSTDIDKTLPVSQVVYDKQIPMKPNSPMTAYVADVSGKRKINKDCHDVGPLTFLNAGAGRPESKLTLSITFVNGLGRDEYVQLDLDHYQEGGARVHHWRKNVGNKDDATSVINGIDYVFHPKNTDGPRAIDVGYYNQDGKGADTTIAGTYVLTATPYRALDAMLTWKVTNNIAGTVDQYCD